MPLQSSGAISLSQIQTEFGGSNPISLSEYYNAASGIPASGTISMNQFYGKSAAAGQYLLSRGYTGAQGGTLYTIDATRDMITASGTITLNSSQNYHSQSISPTGTRFYWNDWGGDWFDAFGNFYVTSNTAAAEYVPIYSLNSAIGNVYTQNYTLLGQSFSIKQGWVATGMFKLDIACTNSSFYFSSGATGNLGSDGSTQVTNYSGMNVPFGNLAFVYTSQAGSSEWFYVTMVPKLKSTNDNGTFNNGTFNRYNAGDNLYLWTGLFQYGCTWYFVKGNSNNVFSSSQKDWIGNDIIQSSSWY